MVLRFCTKGGEVELLLQSPAPWARGPAGLWTEIDVDGLDGHLCRCTGYIKYHEAVRAAVSIGDQATRLQNAHADRRRQIDRQDRRIRRGPRVGWRAVMVWMVR